MATSIIARLRCLGIALDRPRGPPSGRFTSQHENSRISGQANPPRRGRRRAAGHRGPHRPTKPPRRSRNWAARSPSSRRRSTPAAAARARSRTTRSSTACSWSRAPTRPRRSPATCSASTLVTIQTGPEGPSRPPGARRRRLRHRPRAVPGHRRRSRRGRPGADGLERRRHEHRRSRRQDARADLQASRFDPDAGLQPIRSASWPRKLGLKGASVRSAEKFMQALCRVFVELRLQPGRNQPAGRHRSRRADRARRQDDASTTTPCSATRTWPSCATWPKKSRPKSAPARRA